MTYLVCVEGREEVRSGDELEGASEKQETHTSDVGNYIYIYMYI